METLLYILLGLGAGYYFGFNDCMRATLRILTKDVKPPTFENVISLSDHRNARNS